MAFSVKLHIHTFFLGGAIKPSITPKNDLKDDNAKKDVGRVDRRDNVRIDVNYNFGGLFRDPSTPLQMMQMEKVLKFDDSKSFIEAFENEFALFKRDKTVVELCKAPNLSFEMSFTRYDFVNPLPDFVLDAIAQIMLKNSRIKHSFAQKKSVFTNEQTEKLKEKLLTLNERRQAKAQDQIKGNRFFKFYALGCAAIYLLLSYTSFTVALPVIFGAILLGVAIKAVLNMLNKQSQLYENQANLDKIANTPQHAAFIAGKSKPFYHLIKYFRHPFFFLAGFRHVGNTAAVPKKIDAQERRDKCLEAVLKRNPGILNLNKAPTTVAAASKSKDVPSLTLADSSKMKAAAEKESRKNPKRSCRK